MKKGYLSQYFEGVAIKRLSKVEADSVRSNQHEFNGVTKLKNILGKPQVKTRYPARFLYLTDQDDEPIVDEGFLTWYDAREKGRIERGTGRSERRLYFPPNLVMQNAAEGDLLVVAKLADNTLLAIVAEHETTIKQQLLWLFGFTDVAHPGFSVKSELETEQDRISFAANVVLEQIGIFIADEAPNYLDLMLDKFRGEFPKTIEFSDFARSTISDLSSQDDPDIALISWMEREEVLFRTLEKHLLGEKLRNLSKKGEIEDTDTYLQLALSVLNRRKSRAGSALENHLEQIFKDFQLTYTRGGVTEGKSKPDFVFPGIAQYHDNNFDPQNLTMLASKSTCKDRWRQILSEAKKIQNKHLLTLEPSISLNQTNEMQQAQVQLVLPKGIHNTYSQQQQSWLMDLSSFLALAKERQAKV